MQATLLTLLLVTGAPDPAISGQRQPPVVVEDCGCTAYRQSGCGCTVSRYRRRGDVAWGCVRNCLGPMPQTCYAPRFGCYPGNNRHMHRYPAFHGYYYRQAYNYRRLFDYPWHATPHEPQGFLIYTGGGQTGEGEEIRTPDLEQGGTMSEPSITPRTARPRQPQ